MLTVAKMRNILYYTTLAAEDYYVGRKCSLEPQGKWMGKGAEKLGLDAEGGIIKDEQFKNLFHGYSADGEKKFVRNAGLYKGTERDRMPGYDLTFSAPKSVSICWAIGGEETRKEIEQAHQKAIEKTIEEIEKKTHIRTGKGGKVKESCGLIVGVFQHATARQVDKDTLPDMQLHSHATVINTGVGVRGGKTGAVNGFDFLNEHFAKQYGAFYRAELASHLVRLGFELERTKDAYEIKGVSEGLITEFSKRSEQIEKEIDREKATAKEKLRANKATRQKKHEYKAEEITDHWTKTAEEKHHFTRESVEKLRGRFEQEEKKREGELAEQKGKEETKKEIKTIGLDEANIRLKAIRQAAEELNAEQPGFTKKELTDRAMQICSVHGIKYEDVKQGVNDYLKREGLKVGEKETPYEKKTESGEIEKKIFKELVYMATSAPEVVKMVVEAKEKVEAVKTAAFKDAVGKYKDEGKNVIVAAWSNKKAEDLEEKTGLKTTTIQKILSDKNAKLREAAARIEQAKEEKGTTIRRIKANFKHATWQWSAAERDRYTGDNLKSKWMADFRYATRQISKAEKDYIHRQIDIVNKAKEREERAINENTVVIFDSQKSGDNKTLQEAVQYVQSRGGQVVYANDLRGQGTSVIENIQAAAAAKARENQQQQTQVQSRIQER